MRLETTGEIWYWRGPSPFHFVTVAEPQAELIAAASELITYGWGMIPVTASVGASEWTTSLWPKDGGYIVPIKADIRRREELEVGDVVTVSLVVGV